MTDEEVRQLIVDENEKVLDLLVNSCKKVAKEWGTTSVPITYIEQASNVLMESFRKGIEDLEKVMRTQTLVWEEDRLYGNGGGG